VDKQKLVTQWHGYRGYISEKTRVLWVGKDTVAVSHRCSNKKKEPNKMHLENPLVMGLWEATHNTLPSAYCTACDLLYVGLDEEPKDV
jgi:hypothetical protein